MPAIPARRFNPAQNQESVKSQESGVSNNISALPDPQVAQVADHIIEHLMAQPPAIKKVSFGGIAKKKDETKTAYPVLPDLDGQAAILAARIIEHSRTIEALEGAVDADKDELKARALPFYFAHGRGKIEVPSSVSVPSPAGEVLVTFASRYKALPDESSVLTILGAQTSQWFRQSFELKVDGDKLPLDGTQELLNELQELFARHNAGDALSYKEIVKPTPEFHTQRHLQLTPEQNLALDAACPIVASVKTKGRK